MLNKIKTLLPNARIVEFLDCHVIVDKNGEEIGYYDNGLYLNEGYEYGQEVYERLLCDGVVFTGFYNSKQSD